MRAVPPYAYIGDNTIDPSTLDGAVYSLLVCVNGEKYMDIFKSRNISQDILVELNDDDLRKLGVDDPDVRADLIREAKNLPIYDHVLQHKRLTSDLELGDIAYQIRDTNTHIHRIHLSMVSINFALRRRAFPDVIVGSKRATTIILNTLDDITKILDKMENHLETNFQYMDNNYETKLKKKIMVGTVGGAVISVLAVLFVRAVRNAR